MNPKLLNWRRALIVIVAAVAGLAGYSQALSGTDNGHEWVDMGTSVKWATTNVGASTLKDYGDYFAWGEISPKSEYTVENSLTNGKEMDNIAGNSSYDAARANWGGNWRMPTAEDFDELTDKCDWEWYGNGMKVTAKNGNVIYLPAAGWQYMDSAIYVGMDGYYWSASPSGGYASFLGFDSVGWRVYCTFRNRGHSIRPVLE